MTWETSFTFLLLAGAVAITFAVVSFFLVCLAWRWFWKWLRDELLSDWEMLDRDVKANSCCKCDCKKHDVRLNNWSKKP